MAAKGSNKDADTASAPAEAAPKKSGKKLVIIIVALLLVLGGGGGGAAWWFLKHRNADEAAAHAADDDDADEAPRHTAKKSGKKDAEPPHVFVHLDPFTTNLADDGGDRVAQITVNLEMDDEHAQQELERVLPKVRSNTLKLISARESKELLTIAGKNALADDIATRTGIAMGWEPPEPVDEISDLRKVTNAPAGAAARDERHDDAHDEPAPRKARRRAPRRTEPNPVVAVHFETFIVQ